MTEVKSYKTTDKSQMTAAKQYKQAVKTKAKELLLPTRGFAIVGLDVIAISSSNSTQLQFGLDSTLLSFSSKHQQTITINFGSGVTERYFPTIAKP